MTDISPARRSPNQWIRQIHRWLSILFTLTVIVTFIALAQPEPMVWVSYTPLPPLFLLLASGLYLFALPYIAKWRRRERLTKWPKNPLSVPSPLSA